MILASMERSRQVLSQIDHINFAHIYIGDHLNLLNFGAVQVSFGLHTISLIIGDMVLILAQMDGFLSFS
jgi:hypothetical protein